MKFFITILIIALTSYANNNYKNFESCKISDKVYIQKRQKYLKFYYSGINYSMTLVTYHIGKTTWDVLQVAPDISIDILSGMKYGGIHGAIASVVVNQGIDLAVKFTKLWLKNPASVSESIGATAMSEGIRAMKENRKLFLKGWYKLTKQERKKFRKNQIAVDLLGEAKKLYLTAQADNNDYTGGDKELTALDQIEDLLNKSQRVSNVMNFYKVLTILESFSQIKGYQPYNNYAKAIDTVMAINYNQRCIEKQIKNKQSISSKNIKKVTNVKSHNRNSTKICEKKYNQCTTKVYNYCREKSDFYKCYKQYATPCFQLCPSLKNTFFMGEINSCKNIKQCRSFCYKNCDHNHNNQIGDTPDEHVCYSICNKNCDDLCFKQKVKKKKNIKSQHTGTSKWRTYVEVLYVADKKFRSNPKNLGIKILGPNGAVLNCWSRKNMYSKIGKCRGRQIIKNEVISEVFMIKKNNPGNYQFIFDFPSSSKYNSIKMIDGSIRYPKTKNSGNIIRFKNKKIYKGRKNILTSIYLK